MLHAPVYKMALPHRNSLILNLTQTKEHLWTISVSTEYHAFFSRSNFLPGHNLIKSKGSVQSPKSWPLNWSESDEPKPFTHIRLCLACRESRWSLHRHRHQAWYVMATETRECECPNRITREGTYISSHDILIPVDAFSEWVFST